ncbi:MAG: chain-length determining protein [Hydrogenophaga sp.]|uniref:chain-length determining protein n=1 Tax=Hydrogenophaga sp. TaxID=1904254 RepID=UPI003D9B7AD5
MNLDTTRRLIGRHRLWSAAIASILGASLYWGLVASDRYVSEARIVVDQPGSNAVASLDLSGLLGSSRNHNDSRLLRDYLLTVDMLQKLQASLDLRAHYSDPKHDILSRLWSRDVSVESLHDYYLKRVHVELDDASGALRLRVEAFDAAFAQRMAQELQKEGETFINGMAQSLAKDQVLFLEGEVKKAAERSAQSRARLLQFQNRTGLLSPQAKAESVAAILARIEGQLSDLRARRQAMLGYLSPDSADVAQLNLQIQAQEQQLRTEQGRLASSQGSALNKTMEEFQQLELDARLTQELYTSSLTALEKGRIEATRTLRKVSVIQRPSLAEYPLEPRRLYNIIVFALAALLATGVVALLKAIVRDHQD